MRFALSPFQGVAMSHQVFISYSTRDAMMAEKIRDRMESAGIGCWMAPRDMTSFLPYGETILRALIGCRVVVVVFSSHANDSPYVRREVERGVAHRKALATIRVENTQPRGELEFFLSTLHWVDAIGPQVEMKLDELVANVGGLLASLDENPPSLPDVIGEIKTVPPPNDPGTAESMWLAVIEREEYRDAILNLTSRIVRNRQPVVSLFGASDADQVVLHQLGAERIVNFQPSPIPSAGDYVMFASPRFARHALADWLASKLDVPTFDFVQEAQRFPLLADGVSQLICSHWKTVGRQLLERCVVVQDATTERIVAGLFMGQDRRNEMLTETQGIVLSKGSLAAQRGLARGAQHLMEAGHTGTSLEIYSALSKMLRERQQPDSHFEAAVFLVEISNEYGRILKREGKLREATDHFRATLEDALKLGDDVLIGTVTNNLASCLLALDTQRGSVNDEVKDLLLGNERRLRNCGCQRQLAVTCHYLGRLYYGSDPKQAEAAFLRDVSHCRSMNDSLALADALNSLGVYYANHCRYEDADVAHKEEVGLFHSVFDPLRQARAFAASGANCLARGFRRDERDALERARKELNTSLAVYRRLDQKMPQEEAAVLENLGRTHFLLGDMICGKELMLGAADLNDQRPGGQQLARKIRDELDSLG